MVTTGINKKSIAIENDPVRQQMLKVREEHARKQKFDYSHVFRRKSRFDLIRLSCMIMGIEFAYAVCSFLKFYNDQIDLILSILGRDSFCQSHSVKHRFRSLHNDYVLGIVSTSRILHFAAAWLDKR